MWNYVQGQNKKNLFFGELWLPSQNARTRVILLQCDFKLILQNVNHSLEDLHEQDLANDGGQLVQHVLPVPLPTEHWLCSGHQDHSERRCRHNFHPQLLQHLSKSH